MTNTAALRREADAAFNAQDFARAAELYRKVVAREPTDLHAWTSLGTALHCAGDLAGSEEAHRRALSLFPSARGWFLLAAALQEAGKEDEAEHAFRASLTLDRNLPESWKRLTELLQKQRRWPEMSRAAGELVRLEPDVARGFYLLAIACAMENRWEDSLDAARRARSLDPRAGGAWIIEGCCLLDLKRPAEAVAAFDRLVELDPDFEEVYFRRGIARFELGQWSGALDDMRRAARQQPERSEECRRWIARAENEMAGRREPPPPQATAAAPAPVPVGRAPAPVPVGGAPGPVPMGRAPAPIRVGQRVGDAPAPVPARDAPAPVPVAAAPAPAPVRRAPPPETSPRETAEKPASPLTVPDHGGGSQPEDAVFFAPPPSAIGPLDSAATTLRRGMQPAGRAVRIAKSVVAGVIGAAIAAVCLAGFQLGMGWLIPAAAALGCAAAAVSWDATAFKHRCSYVGRDGLAVLECRSAPDEVARSSVLLFQDAAWLRASRTNVHVNGAYRNTRYHYVWTDAKGTVRWTTSGVSSSPSPPSDHDMHFAAAAERAWTRSFLSRANDELRRFGHLDFKVQRSGVLAGERRLRVGQGWIELLAAGRSFRHEAADVACVRLHDGEVSIRPSHPREPIFGTEDEYTFGVGDMANLNAFLAAVEQVGGIRVSV